MNFFIPRHAALVLDRLQEAGFEGYCVGGCVRDMLLGRKPDDWDVTTNALPHQVMELFPKECVRKTGLAHGTVTILSERLPVEVTTYRIDGEYHDGRHPDEVTFTRSLREDLARRDFTVNALAYAPQTGIIDFFDGMDDLSNQRIRCVGVSDLRFQEDALRILRALRFSAVLGFSIEQDTAKSLRDHRNNLSQVSVERIASELERMVCGQDVDRVIGGFADVLQQVIPALSNIAPGLNRLPPHPALRLTWLLSDLSPEQAAASLVRLRYPTALQKNVLALHSHLADSLPQNCVEMRRFLHCIGAELAQQLLLLKAVRGEDTKLAQQLLEAVVQSKDCWSLKRLAIRGNDLVSIGVAQGPMIGQLLEQLLQAVISEQIPNESKALLEAAATLKKGGCFG